MEAYIKQCNQNLEILSIRRSCTNVILSPADYRNIEDSIKNQGEVMKVLITLKYMDVGRTKHLEEVLLFTKDVIENRGDSDKLINAIERFLSLFEAIYYIEDVYMSRLDANFKDLVGKSEEYKRTISDIFPEQMLTFLVDVIDKMVNDVTVYRAGVKSIYLRTMSSLDIKSIYETDQIWPSSTSMRINQPEGTLESQFLLQVKSYFRDINIDVPIEELQSQLNVIDKFEKILSRLKEYEHSDDIDELLDTIHDKLSIISSSILERIKTEVIDVENKN